MFDFLFKRPAAKPSSKSVPASEQKHEQKQQQQQKSEAQAEQRAASQQAKLAAAARADALVGDEAATADFILQCEFADVRLKAAEHVHSKQMLEKVQQGMRNTDRRVAKLMQSRLEVLLFQEAQRKKAQVCIDSARRLLDETNLLPNQVSELDRAWLAVGLNTQSSGLLGDAIKDLGTEFDLVRAALSERLLAQAGLQRTVIDALAQLRKLQNSSEALPPNELIQNLHELQKQVEQHRNAPEVASLPKQLFNDFDQECEKFAHQLGTLEQRYAALAARIDALDNWENLPVAELSENALKHAWIALPTIPDPLAAAQLQARYDALIQQIHQLKHTKDADTKAQAKAVTLSTQQHFGEILDAMEAALQQGSLHLASEHDKAMRDAKTIRPSEAQMARLVNARAELHRLQSWAKWGGNVSREELVKTVEELPISELAATELAKKVGSSRARWKELDSASGPAPKTLWDRFDAACTLAYAPAAAHFKHLSDERQHNLAKGQAMVAEVAAFAADLTNAIASDAASVDWKNAAGFNQRMVQAWHRLGPIDRKDKKRLDGEFNNAMKAVMEPLSHQRQLEMTRREKMIAEVTQLNPSERSAVEVLRGLQEQWQEQAKALPLERKAEQALWQRFRSACDAVFAKRKESANVADTERRGHLSKKEELCARLEAMALAYRSMETPGKPAESAKMLSQAASEWLAIGAVPRAIENQIDARYHKALAALQDQIDNGKRKASEAQYNALREKMRLCFELEASIGEQGNPDSEPGADQAWNERWQALPSLAAEFERTLQSRFNAALGALQSGQRAYAAMLENNRPKMLEELLRLEIANGLDSPAEFSKDRLRLQVEVLQSSLKSGQKPLTQKGQLLRLCGLAARVDAQSTKRIEKLLGGMGS